jgi:hypothetical protein
MQYCCKNIKHYSLLILVICSTQRLVNHIWQHLKAAVVDIDLSVLGIDATKSLGLAICEVIHGRFGEVEAVTGVVNCKNIDSLAVVCHTVAGAALQRMMLVAVMWESIAGYIPEGCSSLQRPSNLQCEGSQQRHPDFPSRTW